VSQVGEDEGQQRRAGVRLITWIVCFFTRNGRSRREVPGPPDVEPRQVPGDEDIVSSRVMVEDDGSLSTIPHRSPSLLR